MTRTFQLPSPKAYFLALAKVRGHQGLQFVQKWKNALFFSHWGGCMNISGYAHRRHIGLVCCIMFADLTEVKGHQAHDFRAFMAIQTLKLQAKTNRVVLVSSWTCPIVWRTWMSYPVYILACRLHVGTVQENLKWRLLFSITVSLKWVGSLSLPRCLRSGQCVDRRWRSGSSGPASGSGPHVGFGHHTKQPIIPKLVLQWCLGLLAWSGEVILWKLWSSFCQSVRFLIPLFQRGQGSSVAPVLWLLRELSLLQSLMVRRSTGPEASNWRADSRSARKTMHLCRLPSPSTCSVAAALARSSALWLELLSPAGRQKDVQSG